MNPPPLQLNSGGDCLHLVQITDTHLSRRKGGALLGLDTDFSLQHVLRLVRAERPAIDLLLGTGDIADHGSKEAYLRAAAYFDQLGAPCLWLAGNHDQPQLMADILGQQGQLRRIAQSDAWQVIMLDSQLPDAVGGALGATELALLERHLAAAEQAARFSLVCLHHQPVPVGAAWIDRQMLADHAAFFALIDRYASVRGILWGHVHQQLERRRGTALLMSTPSSCIQFVPGSDTFKLDDQPPGYRWLELFSDGRISTGVSRVRNVEFSVDLNASGYR